MKRFILIAILCFSIYVIRAGGYQVNLQGVKQTAMGHCGIGFYSDAAGMFFNPGSLSMIQRSEVVFGSHLIFPSINYLEPAPGTNTTSIIEKVGTPISFYLAAPIDEENRMAAGIAVYTPFGSGIQYPDEWIGQFVVQQMSLKTIFVQPTLSFGIDEHTSAGIGVIYGYGDFMLKKSLPLQLNSGEFGTGTLSGKAEGYGFNVGVYHQREKLSIGLAYRSDVSVSTDLGSAVFVVPEDVDSLFPSTSFSTKITLPGSINFGMGFKVKDNLTVTADLNYINWSVYDTLSFDFAENTEKLNDIHSPRMYHDAVIIRGGVQYDLDKNLVIRMGMYGDFSPVDDDYITPETPDANKWGTTLGVSYTFKERFTVDFTALNLAANPRTATNLETGFGGTWKSSAMIVGLGIQVLL